MVSIKGRKFYNKSVITQITENHYRDTVGCLLHTSVFISQGRFCSGLGWCTWETRGPSPGSCVLLQSGQDRSLGRLTRRGVSSLPQIGRWRKNCSGKNKGPFWRQVHFKTVIPNVAYSIPCAPCRGVVPSRHWTFGVILGVRITRCHHSDQLSETIQSVLPNLYAFPFLAWKKKKKSRKGKAESPEERTFFEWRSPRGDYSGFPGAEECVCFSFCTHTGCLAPSPGGPGFPSTSWSCSFLGALLPQLPSRNCSEGTSKGRNHGMERT